MPNAEKGVIYVLALIGVYLAQEGYQDLRESRRETIAQLAELQQVAKTQIAMSKDIVNRLDDLSHRGDELEVAIKGLEDNVLYYAGITKSSKQNKVILGVATPKGDQFKVESELSDNNNRSRR